MQSEMQRESVVSSVVLRLKQMLHSASYHMVFFFAIKKSYVHSLACALVTPQCTDRML